MICLLVNIYPTSTMARYMLSSYVLKAYIDEYYNNSDLTVKIINLRNTINVEKAVEKILNVKPDLIGYSCYIWNIETILKIIKVLKENIQTKHILGGPEISLKRVESLEDPTIGDYYIIGEGERKILDLLRYLEKLSENEEFPKGIIYHNNGNLYYEENTDVIENLDEIPSIYLKSIIDNRLFAYQQAFLETQRGCRFRCKYCVYPKFNPKIYYYTLERVFKELKFLILDKKVSALRIFDALFTSDLERAKSIVKFLIELKNTEKIQLPWIYWEYNYFTVDDDFLELICNLKNKKTILNSNELKPLDRPQHYSDMVKDYIALNCIGIQSFQNKVLKAVGRPGIDKELFEKFMNKINKNNLVLKADLILGLPYETFDTYFDGIEYFLRFLKNTDHILNLHILEILPGSELEELCEEYEIEYSRDSPHQIFSTNTMDRRDIELATKLSAVLFRIVNSPLRKYFFELKESKEYQFMAVINLIFDEIKKEEKFKNTDLINKPCVDDEYWNEKIFNEIPSSWLIKIFKKYMENSN